MEIKENNKLSYGIINSDVEELLIQQLSHEEYNRNLYITISLYFNDYGYKSLYYYYQRRADEELNHYNSIRAFLDYNHVLYDIPTCEKITEDWNTMEEPFKITLDKELETTKQIYKIVEVAMANNDYITMQWLLNPKGLVAEQSEEISISKDILEISMQDSDWHTKEDQIFTIYSNRHNHCACGV